jgi:hypothetical protein
VEAFLDYAGKRTLPVRGLSCSSTAMPFIKDCTPTYYEFAHADLSKIYGDKLKTAGEVTARDLKHMVFMNRGGRFEAVPLPPEAQMTVAFGVSAADFDGDGNQDIFMAQNFSSGQVETPRVDAGRGLLLLGNGAGQFRPVSAAESGIAIYGEQRGCAVSDYDGDGRLDMLVAQPNNETKLLRNRRAKPGLRVKIEGGSGNPQGIGAIVRPVTAAGAGAAQVVSAGSGYWSQNSATLVVTSAKPITALSVRWPDGRVQEQRVPADAKEITLRPPPQLTRAGN